ncbi:hypothetical protein C2E23DRAFT_810372, partial [Lenzites betulinus]
MGTKYIHLLLCIPTTRTATKPYIECTCIITLSAIMILYDTTAMVVIVGGRRHAGCCRPSSDSSSDEYPVLTVHDGGGLASPGLSTPWSAYRRAAIDGSQR